MTAVLGGPCGSLPGSATVRAATVPGHCHARQNGCGAPTPFRVTYGNGDVDFVCNLHLARTLREAGTVDLKVRVYDPPLRLGDGRLGGQR